MNYHTLPDTLADRPHPRVLRLTLNRPERLNALTPDMHRAMTDVWRTIDADPDVSAVILTGAGRGFSAGGDLDLVQRMIGDYETRIRVWKEARDMVYNMIGCSKPIISAINGPAVGAGIVLALMADITIAAYSAKLIDGHTTLGVASGEPLDGREAERIGLVSLAVPDEALQAKALETAVRLAEGPQSALRWTKLALNHWLRQAGPIFEVALATEFLGFSGPELLEGVKALQEGRKPAFPPGSPV
jgi:enoyl-CoA hydratase